MRNPSLCIKSVARWLRLSTSEAHFHEKSPHTQEGRESAAVLIQILTTWFDQGTLEYVCRWHRIPQLACGAVPKNTEPFVRMITDGRPINVYARAWRVKYVTVTDLCLIMTWKALMTVRDLKVAYHLVRYSGCRGDTRYLIRWIT